MPADGTSDSGGSSPFVLPPKLPPGLSSTGRLRRRAYRLERRALSPRHRCALAPALLGPVAKSSWSIEGPVQVAGRRYNGATYVIAVNTSTAPATASFSVPGLGGRKLEIFRDGRVVKPLGDLVVDKLPGLGVAVYIAPLVGW